MTVLNFHSVKIITTYEGDMVLTNSQELYQKLLLLRSHGIIRDKSLMKADDPWYYEQITLGYNFRLTELQAALGISQLNRLNEFIKRWQALANLAKRYDFELSSLSIILTYQHPDAFSTYHLYVIRVKQEEAEIGRKEVFKKLREANIGVNVHYIPLHTQPYYRRLGFTQGQFLEAEKYYQEAISIPIYYALSDEQQTYVINKLKEILRKM